jgi:Type IV secretion system pilin
VSRHLIPRSPSPPPEKFEPPTPAGPAGTRRRPRLGGGLVRATRRAGLLLTAAAAVLAVSSPASAAARSGPVLAVKTLPEVISGLTGWVVGILAITATLFLTVGGLRYLIAGGDPGEVEKAKTALKSAAVGYALALLAPVIVDILKQVLGA